MTVPFELSTRVPLWVTKFGVPGILEDRCMEVLIENDFELGYGLVATKGSVAEGNEDMYGSDQPPRGEYTGWIGMG